MIGWWWRLHGFSHFRLPRVLPKGGKWEGGTDVMDKERRRKRRTTSFLPISTHPSYLVERKNTHIYNKLLRSQLHHKDRWSCPRVRRKEESSVFVLIFALHVCFLLLLLFIEVHISSPPPSLPPLLCAPTPPPVNSCLCFSTVFFFSLLPPPPRSLSEWRWVGGWVAGLGVQY